MLRVVSVNSDLPGVFAVGMRPYGLAISATVLAGLTVGWWFGAGQPLAAALF